MLTHSNLHRVVITRKIIRNLLLIVTFASLLPLFSRNASAILFITEIIGAGCRQFAFDGLASSLALSVLGVRLASEVLFACIKLSIHIPNRIPARSHGYET